MLMLVMSSLEQDCKIDSDTNLVDLATCLKYRCDPSFNSEQN
jgi:hypothetical protein